MGHLRLNQIKAGGALVAVTIILAVLTGVLFAHAYVSKLLERVVPGSADIVIAALVIAWW